MNICKQTDPHATCCFTGHRSVPCGFERELSSRLNMTISELYAGGVRNFRCGGALGFDTMAAIAVLRMREKAEGTRLVLILPCFDQTARWRASDVRLYERIRSAADEVVYSSAEYSRENMLLRNRALVDGSGVCVAYMDHYGGGTAYTVKYARRVGVRVINLGSVAME